jgi:hypothetical protein
MGVHLAGRKFANVRCQKMDMIGKTVATIGAAWLCLLFTLLLFDYVQDAVNGQSNVLFAGWGLLEIALSSVPGIALVALGLALSKIY